MISPCISCTLPSTLIAWRSHLFLDIISHVTAEITVASKHAGVLKPMRRVGVAFWRSEIYVAT